MYAFILFLAHKLHISLSDRNKETLKPLVRSIYTYERLCVPQKELELEICPAKIYKSLQMIFLSKIDKEKRPSF
jgi:hypothetical protein